MFDLLLRSWEKHASDLVLVPGSHCATGVILFLLCISGAKCEEHHYNIPRDILNPVYCTVSVQRFMTFFLFLIISKIKGDIPFIINPTLLY